MVVEKWRNMAKIGYSQYEVSDKGNVRHAKTKRIKSQTYDKDGYARVRIYNKTLKKEVTIRVHKLVALMFLPNKMGKYRTIIDHKDRNKRNNNVKNLRWVNARENMLNRDESNLSKKTMASRSIKVIIQYTKDREFIKRWDKNELKDSGVKLMYIYRCIDKIQKTHKGFIWEKG